MKEEDMQQALLKLAFEMTASVSTANMCISDMDLENDEQLFDVAQYLKALVYLAQGYQQ
jgi:hypothetical protein